MRVSRIGTRVIAAAGAAAVVFGGSAPGFAEPGVSVPDDGSRPAGGAADDTPVTDPDSEGGPLGDQVEAAQNDVAHLAEATTAASDDLAARQARLAAAQSAWNATAAALEAAQTALDTAAGEAYADTAGVPESDLPDLSALGPLGDEWDLPALSSEVDEAEDAEAVAHASYDAAALATARAQDRYTALDTELDAAQAALDQLILDNLEAIEQLEREREAAAAEYSGDFSSEVDGWEAAPEALAAVEFALAQLGKPYVWGDEGPDTYDCSGLVQASYDYAGVTVPRVAADQFNATRDKPVDVEKLLPGDLLFWWDDPGNWRSVYHVGMYLGDGKMIQAPRTGDVVKISSVWFENFAGAHRVVDAVQTDPDAGDPSAPDDPTTPDAPSTPDDGTTLEPDPSTPDEPESPDPDPTDDPDDESPSETPSESPSPSPSATPTEEPGESPVPTVSDLAAAVLRESEA